MSEALAEERAWAEFTLKELDVPLEVTAPFPGPGAGVTTTQVRYCGRMRYGGGDDHACVIILVSAYSGSTIEIRSFVASESEKLFRSRYLELRQILRTLVFLAPS